MMIFLLGATGALGRPLVPLLLRAGHDVTGTTRSPDKAALVEAAGAQAAVVDAYDADALAAAAVAARPAVVISLLTDLASEDYAANSRLRHETTPNVVAATLAAGARKLLCESIAFPTTAAGDAAVKEMERQVLETDGFEGVILRYGRLYGPGTWHEDGSLPEPPHVSVDAAAQATLAALDAPAGILEVVD
jgi:nucleoside-diphosphate-sugar epimerase